MDYVMPFSIKRKRDLLIKKKKRKTDDVMPLNRCSKRQKNLFKCGIDNLPDELLIAILSCLTFQEAARTCILSQRWRYLWKYTTCSIQFYSEGTLEFEAAEKFINSVNGGLKLHQVNLLSSSKLVLSIQVKVFELNMAAGPLDSTGLWRNYSIPHVQKLLSISGEVKLLKTLTTLKSFRFVNIRITQEVVEFLLSRCPVLEQVCISASKSLKRLKVAGSLPKLRSMEISNCDSLKTMKLTIGGDYAGSFIFDAHKHSSYCRNLKKLKLKVSQKVVVDISPIGEIPSEHPQLYNLKELELDITLGEDDGLCFFTFLTKCSPQLSRLTFKMIIYTGHPQCAFLMNKKAIRECVEQLKANLPPGAELSTHGPERAAQRFSNVVDVNLLGYTSPVGFASMVAVTVDAFECYSYPEAISTAKRLTYFGGISYGKEEEHRTFNLVRWETVTTDKEAGGLGVKNFKIQRNNLLRK
ncbi:PREDICTED: FBD-associated F-box protein At4g10400-like [Nicotiana attenuata]|uniref:FBD-associated F-box protein At4g10400-like n=1 Tax=Nicotiana attenuata TaxID=49451 RepID=UPI0009055AFE|nr:PREDICTED: FBD-associated F-box protein At4g10400-like [Nicotiana attenuata]